MSNTANPARAAAYRQYFSGSPPTAEIETRDTTAGAWRGADRLHRAADQLEDWSKREGHLVRENVVIGYEAPTRLAQSTMDQEAMAGLVGMKIVPAATSRAILDRALGYAGGVEVLQGTQPATAGPQPFVTTMGLAYSLTDFAISELPTPDARDLQGALADLDRLSEEAREEDLPEPDAEAVENARTLLPRLFEIHPVRYQVSPTERRGVAIDAPMRRGAAVAVECAPDDTVYCFAAIDGNSRRAKFYQMDGLPDVFIAKALRDLAAG